MITVVWKDAKGFLHQSKLKDGMVKTQPEKGLIVDPPDVVHEIDWEEAAKDLHNELVQRGLFTYQDVMKGQNLLSNAIVSALKRKVKDLYRREKE